MSNTTADNKGKLIVISAPSGTGKSTIINRIIGDEALRLEFSVSATTRSPREGEKNGIDYYFLTEDEFRSHIQADDFAEYQEVYQGRFYGTLKSEIERINNMGHNVILDIDVMGSINVKRMYGDHALTIFIAPPSVETLRQRLLNRGTDSIEEINRRVSKAEFEMQQAGTSDCVVVNDDLEVAVSEVRGLIASFVNSADENV
ncbi:MAG: guanylate kinase [Muribaculaceae bacterium]|nr:guanylate kinase [Muribaculaceae bacterium]